MKNDVNRINMCKILKLLIGFIILITLKNFSYGQKRPQPYQNRKYHTPEMSREIEMKRDSMFNNADYIFEGRVLNEKYAVEGYYGNDSLIYTSVKIKITKILRGKRDLKLGTIVLLRERGTIIEYVNDQIKFVDISPDIQLRPGCGFATHSTQLFICNKSDLPDNPRNIHVDNPQRVQFFYDESYWEMIYDPAEPGIYVGLKGMEFEGIDELYQFLKKYKNITTKETIDKNYLLMLPPAQYRRHYLREQQRHSS